MQVLKDGEIDTLYFDLVIPEKKKYLNRVFSSVRKKNREALHKLADTLIAFIGAFYVEVIFHVHFN